MHGTTMNRRVLLHTEKNLPTLDGFEFFTAVSK